MLPTGSAGGCWDRKNNPSGEMMTIKILLVDDHAILRQGLRALLESEPDFQVTGEASTGLEALKKVETLNPDVVILDLGIPDLNGLEVTRRIHEDHPQTKIVILSMHEKEAYIIESVKYGASAYILKGSEAWELTQAIRQAMLGKRYLSSTFDENVIDSYLKKTQTGQLEPFETLTSRERQIMFLAAEGLSNQDIAQKLTISPRTVEVHRARVMHKLNLQNHAELVRYAITRKLIPLDDESNPFMITKK
jgi:two-component system, NarL family, response regulator NreC